MHFQRHKINKLLQIVFVSLVFLFVLVAPSLAQNLGTELIEETATTAGIGGADLPTVLGRIFKIVLSVLGLIALIIVIIAGIQWMTSGGNPEKIKKAKALLSAGLIGLLIIICAYAMVSFIISSLGGVTTGGTGCTPGLCCNDGWRCDSNSECTIPDATCSTSLPQEYFRLVRGEADFRSPSFGDYTIYTCSKIRAVFNHNINKDTFDVAVANSTLKVVDSGNNIVNGTWEATGGSILFTPENFWTGFGNYELIIPRTISDTNYKTLAGCASGFTPPYACTSDTTTVIWAFSANDESDETPPYISDAYPIMDVDDPLYPDRNVSRAPMIDVIFNENIDYTTIIDTSHIDYDPSDPSTWHPKNNFQLCEIDGEDELCTIGNEYNNNNLIIAPISQGFRIFITNAQWLDAFTWYEIQVDGIKDMCLNTMAGSQSWEFETNNSVPAARDWWPKGDNVCPDALIGIRFATSMYEWTVDVDVINNDTGAVEFEGSIHASDLNPGPYKATLDTLNGFIEVVDDDDTNISNQFKVFQLELSNTLNTNTSYTVIFDTDLVIDVDGNTLSKEWDFDVTNMEECACVPVIYQVLPNQGPRKSCVTITGHCFKGTTERPATIDPTEGLWFDDTQDPPLPEQDGSIFAIIQAVENDSITTIIPGNYGDPEICKNCLPGEDPILDADIPDFLGVGIKIVYEDNSEEVETFSENQFTVIDNTLAQGPCIWRLNPNQDYVGNRFNIEGIKFGLTPGTINMENWPDNLIYYGTWMPELIKQVMVPGFTTAGDRDVTVIDNNGYVSNPVPFDVIFDRPNVKEFGCNPPPEYSSPSPYKNTEDACTDIVLVVEFNKDMLMDSSPNGVLNIDNYTIESCGSGEIFNLGYCPGNDILISGVTRYDLSSNRIVRISLDTPPLDINTWYQVSIASNLESHQSVQMGYDYVWHFKTRDTDVCPVDSLDLTPKNQTIMGCSLTQVFVASPMASNCNALTPGSYMYNWSSTDISVATVGAGNAYINTVTGIDGGSTWIRVEEDESLKWTKELLNVNCCLTDEDCEDPDGDSSNRCSGSICDNTYGICTPVINGFNPEEGYYNDWVTIQGCWFNNYNSAYSEVRFNEELSVIPFDKCTSSAWQNEQIIAEVPEDGYPFGAIEVTSAPYGSAFIVSSSSDFISGDSHVGICNLRPTYGIPGTITQLTANDNLLGQGADDDVYYGIEKAISYPAPGWVFQEGIRSQSPLILPLGAIDVKVFQNNYSNTLNFNVDPIGGGPEDLCIEGCGIGCDTGFLDCSSPYRCLEEIAGGCSNCRCCCIYGDPNACNNNLDCFAGQGDCTGSERGLCCGCGNDNQCGGTFGCGFLDSNRCCYNRPAVGLETCTASGGTGVGLNTTFKLTFNDLMDRSRLNNEYIKVSKEGICGNDKGEYDNIANRCYLNGQIVSTNSTDENITIFYPNDCQLTINTEYKTEFIVGDDGEGIRSLKGVSYGSTGSSACTWDNDLNCKVFVGTTATQESGGFCDIVKINVEPLDFTIKGKNKFHDFLALALDTDNNAVCVESFAWTSSLPSIATVHPALALLTTATSVDYGETFIKAESEGVACSTEDPYTCGKLRVTPTDLPRVIEQQGCEICANGGQSPSPWKNSQENCPNAQIVVRFNREMDTSTLIPANIVLTKDGSPVTIDNTDITTSYVDEETILYINGLLESSKDYQVTLISGLEEGTTGIKDTSDLPLDGNRNDIQNGSPVDDYVWEFETGNADCNLNKICINPRNTVQLNPPHPNTQNYYTDTYASNCNYLLANSFNNEYEWTLEDQQPAQPGTDVAEFLPSASPLINEWEAEIQSLALGETDIEVSMNNSTPPCPEINDSVHLIVATNPLIDSVFPEDEAIDVCRNIVITANFNQIMDENTISSDTVEVWGKYNSAQLGLNCTGCGGRTSFENLYNKNIFANLYYQLKNIFTKNVSAQTSNCWCELPANISTDEEDNKTIVKINKGLLDSNREYNVIIKSGNDGVKTKYALGLSDDYEWQFTAGILCELTEILINPGNIYFTAAGQARNITAQAVDSQGNEIYPIDGYSWDWLWESSENEVIKIDTASQTNQDTEVFAQSQEGVSQISATATITVGETQGSSIKGQVLGQVFICENPWLYLDSVSVAPDTNFKFSYCRDNDPLLPRLLLGGDVLIPETCGNGVYEVSQGESCDGLDNTPAHATCLFDCSGWVCDDGYYQDGEECFTNWPSAPSGLLAEIDETNPDTQINLNWNDNSTNENNFKIERKLTAQNWTEAEIITVSENEISYNDVALDPAVTYYYRIKACNNSGCSAYSNEATTTTACLGNQCEDNGNCYDNEDCHPDDDIMKCDNGIWVSSCDDGNWDCNEICDGSLGTIPSHAHCKGDCSNWECDTNWGDCTADPGCETDLLTTNDYCGNCSTSCSGLEDCVDGICVAVGQCSNFPPNLTTECLALLAIYNSNNGEDWVWNPAAGEPWDFWASDFSNWEGLSHLTAEGHIQQLILINDKLFGSIPSEIGDLEYLTQLWLYSNNLTSLPVEIWNLNNLFFLILSNNPLKELPIPPTNACPDLTYLRLSNNNYSVGGIPEEIRNLASIEKLEITYSTLESVPIGISDLINIEHLILSGNNISDVSEIKELVDNGGFSGGGLWLTLDENNLGADDCDDIIYLRDNVSWDWFNINPQQGGFEFNASTCVNW